MILKEFSKLELRPFTRFIISLDPILGGALLCKWMLPDEKWLLCLDRTNWKYGKTNINILVLSAAVEGVSIPLMWTMLDKQDNSNTQD